MHRRGYTLLELSISIIIIGLLIGAVLAGKSLIRDSELNAVSSEFEKYSAAAQNFKDKYNAIPGDMSNATSFWGTDPNCAGTYAGTTPSGQTCNGNGDGQMTNMVAAANSTGELFQFWNQLALAKMIEGNYTGFSGSTHNAVSGQNVPKSRLSGTVWTTQGVFGGVYAGDPSFYAITIGNLLEVGGPVGGVFFPYTPAFTPSEAWNIDSKLDDGMPGTGSVVARSPNGWNNAAGVLSTCTLSTSQTDLTKPYDLAVTSVQCTLAFPLAY